MKRKYAGVMLMITMFVTGSLPVLAQKGNGNIQIRELNPGNFNGVELNEAVEYYLSQGENYLVKVEADENLLSEVKATVNNGILTVNTKSLGGATKLKVSIISPEWKTLKAGGAASVKTENVLKQASFNVSATGASVLALSLDVNDLISGVGGAANVMFTGTAVNHTSEVGGAAALDASGLSTSKTTISLNGAASAIVDAKDELSGNVSGAASLVYKTKPGVLEIKETGAGSVNAMDTSAVKNGEKVMIIEKEEIFSDMGFPGNKCPSKSGPMDFFKKFKKKDKVKLHWAGVHIGINGLMNPNYGLSMPIGYDFLAPDYAKSWFVDLNFFQYGIPIIKKHWHLVTGMGFEFNNYRIENNYILKTNTDYLEAFYDSSYTYKRNKLSTVYFQIPLLFQFDTKKLNRNSTFHVLLGVVGGVRVSSHTKRVFETDGAKAETKTWDDFNLAPFRWSAMLKIGYGHFNVFATYQLNQMFKPKQGPQLYPFNVGITIAGF